MVWRRALWGIGLSCLVGAVALATPALAASVEDKLETKSGKLIYHNVYASSRPDPSERTPKPMADESADGRQVVGGQGYAWMAHPTGQKASSVLLLEKFAPSEVQVGQPFVYTIKVTNLTDQLMLQNVVVTDWLPEHFVLSGAEPQPQALSGGEAQWWLGELSPRAFKTIEVHGSASAEELLKPCGSVTYDTRLCLATTVVKPSVQVVMSAPASVLLCDTIPLQVAVRNVGTGTAGDVMVESVLPPGLTAEDGQGRLVFDAGTLPPGHLREFSAVAKAAQSGTYTLSSTASTGFGVLSASPTVTVQVQEPKLLVTKTGPSRQFVHRELTYGIIVLNAGAVAADEVVVEDQIPSGATFVSATEGGSASGDKVVWRLGSMAAGASVRLGVTLRPLGEGELLSTATVRARCAGIASASAQTKINTISAILLELADQADPVAVGESETYTITVTNQGSAVDTNVRVSFWFEPNLQYVSSSGSTIGTLQEDTVVFEPLASLPAQSDAVWRVVLQGVSPGDTRSKVTLTSDQLTRPVEETEATHIYE